MRVDGMIPAAQYPPVGAVEDELLGAGHHPTPHRHVPRVAVELGPMGFDVPVGKDGQWVVTRIPSLSISSGQGFGQGGANLHASQLTQEMFQGQVLVGEAVDGFQSVALVVVQFPWASETQNGQVHQVVNFRP